MEGKKKAMNWQIAKGAPDDALSVWLSRDIAGMRRRWAMLTRKEAKWPRALTTFRMCLQNLSVVMRLSLILPNTD